jgi:hypothetical protein
VPVEMFGTGTAFELRIVGVRAILAMAYVDINGGHTATISKRILHKTFTRIFTDYVSAVTSVTYVWWRRRESNPRPKMLLVKSLHA